MRRMALLAGLASMLLCTAAQATTTDTFTAVKGRCSNAANWSMGLPTAWNAVVPAGHTLEARGTGTCAMRSFLDEGSVTGFGSMQVGNSLRAEGPAGADVALKITGSWQPQNLTLASTYMGNPQVLDFGPSQISNVVIGGTAHYTLGEAAKYESLWTMQEDSYFDTAGYDVGGMGDTQAGLPATLKMHGSQWDTGELRVAANVSLEAEAATVYQDDGSYGITECHGHTLGTLIVKNFRPHFVNPCTIGTLVLERTADHSPVVFSGAFLPNERLEETSLTIGALTTNGTVAEPVVGEGRVTFVIPHNLTVEGCVTFNEATVVGGTITVDCGGVETVY